MKLVLVVVLAMLAAHSFAATTAREILDRRKALDDGERHWDDRKQTLTFKTVGRGGTKNLGLEIAEKRYPGEERKSILFFVTPPESKGIGFLTFTHKGKPSERWAQIGDRSRLISGTERDDKFMATELTYRDLDILAEMTSWTEDDAASSLRGEDTIDGVVCHVIDLLTKRADIGYAKIALWLGRDDLVPRKLEFFERDSPEPTRRIHQSDIRTVGAIPIAYRTTVETPASHGTTEVVVIDPHFDQHLGDEAFTRRALEEGPR